MKSYELLNTKKYFEIIEISCDTLMIENKQGQLDEK